MKKSLLFLLGLFFVPMVFAANKERVISLGGSVTEIVYELGLGDSLIADDFSSLYPEAATHLPRVGYYRAVPVEGLVAMHPDLILASENAGPAHALESVRKLGVEIVKVSDRASLESLYERVRQIARVLTVEDKGDALIEQIHASVARAQARPGKNLKAALIINRTGTLQAAGSHTAASTLMSLAGLTNVLEPAQQGYKAVSAESLVNFGPELIIVTEGSVQASGGLEKLLRHPAIATTPAAINKRIVVMDDLLALGLGPRVAQAIEQLKLASNAAQ
ncbi:heme/hemin ABC transporter substrate-binding protein [Advenella faeciporci]|nr:helical backbone metal receptor [Advenella faeciporci]